MLVYPGTISELQMIIYECGIKQSYLTEENISCYNQTNHMFNIDDLCVSLYHVFAGNQSRILCHLFLRVQILVLSGNMVVVLPPRV